MNAIKRVAVVTGAGSGVGRATALALLADGWHVALAGRRREALEAVARASGAGERVLAVTADVTDFNSVDALFDRVIAHWGRVDLLFNNAGVNVPSASPEEFPLTSWDQIVATNLSGVYYCIRSAFRVMKAQQPRGGRIINNGSIAAHSPRPLTLAYTATKHAVTGMTKAASLDGRAFDIAVGQIDIGNAQTDMVTPMTKGIVQADGSNAVEPVMDVDVVGRSVCYMASLPLNANVLFHTVLATKMPFIGRG